MNLKHGQPEPDAARASLPGALALRAFLFAAVWWGLSGGATASWAFGACTVAVALAVSMYLQPPRKRPISILGSLQFLAFFLAHSVKGGTQVAIMALRREIDLQPAMLEITLRLPHEAERILLASTLNLLPGTMSTELDGHVLQLHVLDHRMPIEDAVRQAEVRVAGLFRDKLQ